MASCEAQPPVEEPSVVPSTALQQCPSLPNFEPQRTCPLDQGFLGN